MVINWEMLRFCFFVIRGIMIIVIKLVIFREWLKVVLFYIWLSVVIKLIVFIILKNKLKVKVIGWIIIDWIVCRFLFFVMWIDNYFCCLDKVFFWYFGFIINFKKEVLFILGFI